MSDPSLDHVSRDVWMHVYEPSEDTFLMMDALLMCSSWMKSCFSGTDSIVSLPLCVEIGAGSGVLIALLSSVLRGDGVFCATDINPHAAELTAETMKVNGVVGEVVVTDLAEAIQHRMKGKVDVLLFNPPYVPTPAAEMSGDGIERSWAGGKRGREVLDRLLPTVPRLLSPRGMFFLVCVEENEPDEIARILAKAGLHHVRVNKRKAGRERLSIWLFSRTMPPTKFD